MASEGTYYVPESSRLAIWTAAGMALTVFGAGHWINDAPVMGISGPVLFVMGLALLVTSMWSWFHTVIQENLRGLPDAQLKRSYVWGMGWFIFSEVMFFATFFGALFYVRQFALPWLAGDGSGAAGNELLWPGFEYQWPLMETPAQAAGSDKFVGPEEAMGWKGLPLYNTIILLSSSVTVHFAHTSILKGNRKGFNNWLLATIILGACFLFLQVEEYIHAYNELGLTLGSGIYGGTFFLLTGFHGAHVTMGTIMLLTQLIRSYRGHFKADDHFGFEAASWYWHFVDVVWVGLFFFVYIL